LLPLLLLQPPRNANVGMRRQAREALILLLLLLLLLLLQTS
jgi:hypothetical protein